jgi:hypothetical protein
MEVHSIDRSEAWNKKADCYVVKNSGVPVGLLEKQRGSPWKAYVGVGHGSRFVGSSYEGRGHAIDLIAREVAQ